MSNISFGVRSALFTMELRLFWKFSPMNVAGIHRYNTITFTKLLNVLLLLLQHWKFFSVFFALDHSPMHEWSWFYRQFQFCFVDSNDELLRPCLFLRIDIKSPRSVTKNFFVFLTDCAVPSKRISSWPSRTCCTIVHAVLSSRPDRSSFWTFELQWSWLLYLLFTGLTEVEDDTCDGALAIKLIIGRDFAVTRSSPESCWDLLSWLQNKL